MVDVVIVTLDGRHHLEECLPSLVRHTSDTPYRLVVVDNGSEDGTVSWLEDEWPSALVIANESNRGFSAASNQGIRATDGAYVLLLNNDVVLENDALGALVRCAEEEHAGLVGPFIHLPDGEVQPSIKSFPSVREFVFQQLGLAVLSKRWDDPMYYPYGPYEEERYRRRGDAGWLSGACLLFPRDLIEKIGYLDEGMPFGVEDMDLARRAHAAGYRVLFEPAARVLHKKGGTHLDDNATGDEIGEYVRSAYREGILRYFRKHHGRSAYWIVRASMAAGRVPRALFR